MVPAGECWAPRGHLHKAEKVTDGEPWSLLVSCRGTGEHCDLFVALFLEQVGVNGERWPLFPLGLFQFWLFLHCMLASFSGSQWHVMAHSGKVRV